MNSPASNATPRLGFRFLAKVRQGPDAGTSFQLLPPRVTIGRDKTNSIVLNDQRVSRHAATIEFSPEEIVISDVSNRAALFVNNQNTQKTSIKDGDLIRVGESELIFVVEALALPSVPSALPPLPLASQGQSLGPQSLLKSSTGPHKSSPGAGRGGFGNATAQGNYRAPASGVGAGGGRAKIYIAIAILGGLGWYAFDDGTPKKSSEPALRTTEVIQKDIQESETRVDELIKKRTFRTAEERTRFEEAQKHYLAGFRDYQKGQWSRALRSFETARAIDPEHELAGRYSRLAEKQRDEVIALMTLEGRRYKEKQMYARCSAAFEKVLDALPNTQDVKFKQAEALKKECDLMMNDRFNR